MSAAVGRVAQLLSRRVGLHLEPALHPRLARCLDEAAQARGVDVDAFVSSLPSDASAMQELLDLVTVQESSFFRDPSQFEAFATALLPTLDDPVTVWSAGCANGQEPYSLAMVLAEAGRQGWRVNATDISERALARTAAGVYSGRELRGVSNDRLQRHFTEVDDGWQVKPALRRCVHVHRHNLAAEPPPGRARASTVVFCRNVLIYFSRQDAVAFLQRLAGWLPSGAVLFLGYAESLWQLSDRFVLEPLGEAFVYRLDGVPPPAHRTSDASSPGGIGGSGTLAELLAAGEAASRAGDVGAATAAFRRAALAEPSHPVAHVQLALLLEAHGNRSEALLSFRAARAALRRPAAATALSQVLEGFAPEVLAALVDAKLSELGTS